jgi:malate dehydrogenase (oxaloacetate-decarboxylating)
MVRDGLDPQEAARRIWLVGRRGLLTDDMGSELRDFQLPYARPADEVASWKSTDGSPDLAATVARVHPMMLIGTSTQAGAFTEAIVREMARHVDRPIIFPLSNPTARIEARPADLLAWTDGRALVATGSPFPPVVHDGVTHFIAQANNALVFPGLGLGVTVARARRISPGMIQACADAVASLADVGVPGASLLPAVSDLRRWPRPPRAWPRWSWTIRCSRCTRPCGSRPTRGSRPPEALSHRQPAARRGLAAPEAPATSSASAGTGR